MPKTKKIIASDALIYFSAALSVSGHSLLSLLIFLVALDILLLQYSRREVTLKLLLGALLISIPGMYLYVSGFHQLCAVSLTYCIVSGLLLIYNFIHITVMNSLKTVQIRYILKHTSAMYAALLPLILAGDLFLRLALPDYGRLLPGFWISTAIMGLPLLAETAGLLFSRITSHSLPQIEKA